MFIVIELIVIIICCLLTYTVAFIGSPFGGREDSEFVAITVGVMEPEKLEREVSVNLTTEDYVGISNPATGKRKHVDNCLS